MIFISKIDYRFYQKYYKIAFWISLGLLILVQLFGKEVGGATRWLGITETISFQPSEFVKILLILFYAGWLVKKKDVLHKPIKGMVFHLLPVIPIAVLLLLQPHLSATIVIVGIVCVMLVVAGVKFIQMILAGVLAGAPLLIGLIIAAPYRLQRFITFLDPWQDATGDGWQVIQSLYAIGSGRTLWRRTSEKANRNIRGYQKHTMILFLQ